MGSSVEYRAKAAEIDAEAKKAKATPSLAHELENLAHAYLRLAQQAERNSQLDVVYVPPSLKIE